MNIKTTFSLAAFAVALSGQAQEVDVNRNLYRDYTPAPKSILKVSKAKTRAGETRPDHVDNSKLIYYPPVFNQSGGSCGSASNEGYGLTYELNCLRGTDASLPENQLPSHFVYLLAYQNSDREEIAQKNGIPSVADYGGRTYSHTFGEQDCDWPNSGRMQGYDKWFRAMKNRVLKQASFRHNLTTPEGREEFKDWLWNHSGDTAFHAGGVACVGVAITGLKEGTIANTFKNKQIGVVGKKYISSWGPGFDHSVTLVGYDDRIQFDLNGNGKYGEKDADELGAWIMCNSWGPGWANKGFIYVPYKYSYSVNQFELPMSPSVWVVRKDYSPRRTLRIEMDYTHRAELQLKAGVSDYPNATTPDVSTVISCFNFDGNPKDVKPAPEVPMLGDWADGTHHEPMEFGFDVTDLTEQVDEAKDLTYFLQINTAGGAIGKGKVRRLTLIDYETADTTEVEGLEYGVETIDIQNGGRTTYVKVTVPGNGVFSPQTPRFALSTKTFSWKAPKAGHLTLKDYVLYQNDQVRQILPADQNSFVVDDGSEGYLQVAARYTDEMGHIRESRRTEVVSPVITSTTTRAKLSCELDGRYLAFLRRMVYYNKLTHIDLTDATIVKSDYAYYEGRTSEDNTIGHGLFDGCSNLREVNLPANTEVVGKEAFAHCNNLTALEIPDGVSTIAMDAFAYCKNLRKVTIGSSVQECGQGISWDSPIKDVYAKPMTPPTLGIYIWWSNPTIHVYPEALEAYQANERWSERGRLVADLDDFYPRDATAITTPAVTQDTPYVYSLDGIRRNDAKGQKLYIRDGRKFWQK